MLLLLHLVLLLGSALGKTATVDEFVHVPSGCYYWKTGDFTLSGLNPPLVKLWSTLPVLPMKPKLPIAAAPAERDAGSPWIFGTVFMHQNWDEYDSLLFLARVPVMVLSVLAGLVLYLWARRRYGAPAAVLALALFAVEPNLVAHGRLATQDTGMMLAFLLTLYFLDGLLSRGGWRRAVLVGVCLGAACLVKYSGAVLAAALPVVFLAVVLFVRGFALSLRVPLEARLREGRRRTVYRALIVLLLIAVVALVVVNLPYAFAGSFRPLRSHDFASTRMKVLARSPLGHLPAFLPADYLLGLDGQQLSVERGETVNYLNRRWSSKGWWYYYLEAFLLKVPVPLLVLIALGAVSVLAVRAGTRAGMLVMVIAGVLFWALHSFGSNKNIGLRYMLPVFPLLLMLGGRSVLLLEKLPGRLRKPALGVLVLLVAWCAVEAARIYPHYLAYFNQLARGPRGGARYLLDSNIDWGQDLKGLADYLRKERITGPIFLGYFGHVDPALYGIQAHRPYPGVRGIVAVSLNYLCGMRYGYPSGYFNWLRNEKPVAVIGHTIYVYRTDGK